MELCFDYVIVIYKEKDQGMDHLDCTCTFSRFLMPLEIKNQGESHISKVEQKDVADFQWPYGA